MVSATLSETAVLLVRESGHLCAIPSSDVIETMRPLPLEAAGGLPPFLRGLAVIRGSPVPVADLGVLLGGGSDTTPSRFVLLRVDDRRVALAVKGVLGVRRVDDSVLGNLPPLLQAADRESVAAVAVLDEQLVRVLRPARIIPDDVWRAIDSAGEGHDSVAGPYAG